MAEKGYGFREILEFYYPGTQVLDYKDCRRDSVLIK
jgi:peptidoglycan hydrolase-like amidase